MFSLAPVTSADTPPVVLDWSATSHLSINNDFCTYTTQADGSVQINGTAVLSNFGSQTATNVVVSIHEAVDFGNWPTGFVTVSQGSVTPQIELGGPSYNAVYPWNVGSIPAGGSASISVNGIVPSGKHYQMGARDASSGQGSGNPSVAWVSCGSIEPLPSGGGSDAGDGTTTTGGPPGNSPDFSVICTPLNNTITQGGEAAYEVEVTPLNGFNQTLTLTATGVPNPVTYGYSPNNVVGGLFSWSRIAHIANTSSVIPATYTITFIAQAVNGQSTSNGQSNSADCNIEVRSLAGSSAHTLTGRVVGSGSGTITASPLGNPPLVRCASICISSFPNGQSVTVIAAPSTDSTFQGWEGGICSGTGSCNVVMSRDVSVIARFASGRTSTGPDPCLNGCPPPPTGTGSGTSPTGPDPCLNGCPPPTGTGTGPGSGPILPGPPTKVRVDNGACERITVSWDPPSGAVSITGYNIYRSIDGSNWQKLTSGGPLSALTYSSTDTSVTAGISYYYAVTAVNSVGESAKAQPSITPVNVRPCLPNLSSSDKDVIAVNGQKNIISGHLPIPCSNVTDDVKVVKSFRQGDVVKFAVNICNTGDRGANNLSFVDQLSNLTEPDDGWQATYNGVAVTPQVSGSAPNQILTFNNLGNIPAPVAPETVDFRVISFQAKVTAPRPNAIGEFRFQNQGNILMDGDPAKHVQTPPYVFLAGPGIPRRNESAP